MTGRRFLTLILVQAIWAGSYPAMKFALREMPVEVLILLRYALVAIILQMITTLRRKHVPIAKRDIPWVVFLGVVVAVVTPLLGFHGIQHSQAIDFAILVSIEPLATAVLAFVVLKERLDRRKGLSILIAIPGVLLLSGVQNMGAGKVSLLRLFGNLLIIASLFGEGGYTVFSRFFCRRYPPLTLSTYAFTAGFLFFLIFQWTKISFLLEHDISLVAWISVIYLGSFCSAIGYTLWIVLLKTFEANTLALSLYLQGIFGSILGYLLLKETLTPFGWFGAALIVLALFVGYSKRSKYSLTFPVRNS